MDRLSTYGLNREEVVALLEAAQAENERLRAELNAARDALREAPEPEDVDLGPNCCQRCDEYHIWYNGERVAALKGVLE